MATSEADGTPAQPDHDASIGDLRRQLANCQAELSATQRELQTAHEAVVNLEIAVQTNRRIGAAVSIVMSAGKVTEGQAFELLKVISQERNVKLFAIAEHVVRTGTILD